jgi:hypothetical protein
MTFVCFNCRYWSLLQSLYHGVRSDDWLSIEDAKTCIIDSLSDIGGPEDFGMKTAFIASVTQAIFSGQNNLSLSDEAVQTIIAATVKEMRNEIATIKRISRVKSSSSVPSAVEKSDDVSTGLSNYSYKTFLLSDNVVCEVFVMDQLAGQVRISETAMAACEAARSRHRQRALSYLLSTIVTLENVKDWSHAVGKQLLKQLGIGDSDLYLHGTVNSCRQFRYQQTALHADLNDNSLVEGENVDTIINWISVFVAELKAKAIVKKLSQPHLLALLLSLADIPYDPAEFDLAYSDVASSPLLLTGNQLGDIFDAIGSQFNAMSNTSMSGGNKPAKSSSSVVSTTGASAQTQNVADFIRQLSQFASALRYFPSETRQQLHVRGLFVSKNAAVLCDSISFALLCADVDDGSIGDCVGKLLSSAVSPQSTIVGTLSQSVSAAVTSINEKVDVVDAANRETAIKELEVAVVSSRSLMNKLVHLAEYFGDRGVAEQELNQADMRRIRDVFSALVQEFINKICLTSTSFSDVSGKLEQVSRGQQGRASLDHVVNIYLCRLVIADIIVEYMCNDDSSDAISDRRQSQNRLIRNLQERMLIVDISTCALRLGSLPPEFVDAMNSYWKQQDDVDGLRGYQEANNAFNAVLSLATRSFLQPALTVDANYPQIDEVARKLITLARVACATNGLEQTSLSAVSARLCERSQCSNSLLTDDSVDKTAAEVHACVGLFVDLIELCLSWTKYQFVLEILLVDLRDSIVGREVVGRSLWSMLSSATEPEAGVVPEVVKLIQLLCASWRELPIDIRLQVFSAWFDNNMW